MNNQQKYRQILSELGIDDDRQERAIVELLEQKDTALELERVRVSAREDRLQEQLMEMRCEYES